VEQLASKIWETDSFSSKLPFHDVSISMSEFSTFLHKIPSIYIMIFTMREKKVKLRKN